MWVSSVIALLKRSVYRDLATDASFLYRWFSFYNHLINLLACGIFKLCEIEIITGKQHAGHKAASKNSDTVQIT